MSNKIVKSIETIQKVSKQDCSLEGSCENCLEHLEELRRNLESILKPDVLDSLLRLYKALDKGPQQYSWFKRNALDGVNCKYAIMALESFKEKRLNVVKELLKESLNKIDSL